MSSVFFTIFRFLPWVFISILLALNVWVFGVSTSATINEEGLWTGAFLPGKPFALIRPTYQDPDTLSGEGVPQAVVASKELPPAAVAEVLEQQVQVKLKVSVPKPIPPKKAFMVQAGSFVLELGMNALVERLRENGLDPRLETVREQIRINDVQAGPYTSWEDAKEAEATLKAAGMAVDVEETWEGFIISLSQSPLLGYALNDLERARNLGVKSMRMVKIEVDRPVRKVLMGPFSSKDKAKEVSAKVSKLGLAVPVIEEWTSSEGGVRYERLRTR